MSKRGTFFGLLLMTLLAGVPLLAGTEPPAPSASLTNAIAKLDREPPLADLIQKEYGTREDELQWAADRSLTWGEIAALAYIQATTGKSFAEMTEQNAQQDFWTYAENA